MNVSICQCSIMSSNNNFTNNTGIIYSWSWYHEITYYQKMNCTAEEEECTGEEEEEQKPQG